MHYDPVCNGIIEYKKINSIYKGRKYYFCSTGCKLAFESNPKQFTEAK